MTATSPHPESLLVLYLGNEAAVEELVSRAGADIVDPANPYWKANAVAIADPDGFQVVLMPGTWSVA